MKKNSTLYVCSKCDAQYPKWAGRCLECGSWGTVKESTEQAPSKTSTKAVKFNTETLIDLKNISDKQFARMSTRIKELDDILGGGIVPGSINLLGGDPGIGKSTLVLQILKNLESLDRPLLYVSGEESAEQIKLRMNRLKYIPKNLKFLSETNIEQVCAAIQELKPAIAIIDSIQTVYSSDVDNEAGNVAQIRACTVKIMEVAKKNNIPVIITGHVTKDGSVAGPKTLEHLVDVVLYIEGDKLHGFRLIRSNKNRFGSTDELGVFEMTSTGLKEVNDPSRAFLANNQEITAGSVVSCFLDGKRIFLIEVQALVTPTIFGYPQRKTAGFDINRLQMITAVLFKRANLNLNNQDIHLNVAGGFKVTETGIDLAVAMAVASALKNKFINKQTIAIGEVGLGGEVRTVSNIEKRLTEAERLGFKTAFVPNVELTKKYQMNIIKLKNIKDITNNL
jgi:DNA repair protein RadA/Sms